MNLSDAGLAAIEEREGRRLTMYLDKAQNPTIGVGHLLTPDEIDSGLVLGQAWQDGISQDTCDALLRADSATAVNAVNELVTVPLLQHQFDTLVSFVFNIGRGKFSTSTLLRSLNNDQFVLVPDELRQWVHSGGHLDPILVTRRESEIRQWEGAE